MLDTEADGVVMSFSAAEVVTSLDASTNPFKELLETVLLLHVLGIFALTDVDCIRFEHVGKDAAPLS